jgi:hypothetical protein
LSPQQERTDAEAQKELTALLVQAVDRRTQTGEIGLLLSGGADSRAILGCCMQLGRKVTCFSYATEERRGNDYDIARQVAKLAGYPFVSLKYSPADVQSSIEETASYFDGMRHPLQEVGALNQLRGQVSHLLLGDECFGWVDTVINNREQMFYTVGVNRFERFKSWKDTVREEIYKNLLEADAAALEVLEGKCDLPNLHDQKDYYYATERLPRNVLPGRQFINSFAEVMNPWLDKDVVCFNQSLTTRQRRGKALFLFTCRKAFSDLFGIPLSTRTSVASSYSGPGPLMVNNVLFNTEASLGKITGKRSLGADSVVAWCMKNPTLRNVGKRLFSLFGSHRYDPRIGNISDFDTVVRIGLVSWALDNLRGEL